MKEKLTIKSETIETVINGKDISIDVSKILQKGVVYFNATELANAYGKLMSTFLRSKRTKELITFLEADMKSRCAKLRNGQVPIIKVVRGGNDKKGQGTWLHQDLALEFARWLSPEFGLKLDRYVKELFQDAQKLSTERLIGKYDFKQMSREVAKTDDRDYSAEGNLICLAIFGIESSQYKKKYGVKNIWDNQPIEILEKRAKLMEMNAKLIKAGLKRGERLRILSM